MGFCEPLGLIAHAACAEGGLLAGERAVPGGPVELSTAHDLSRTGLGVVQSGMGVEHDLPPVDEHDPGERMFVLAAFDGGRFCQTPGPQSAP